MINSFSLKVSMALYAEIEGFPNYEIRSDGYVVNITNGKELKRSLYTDQHGYQRYVCCLYHEGKSKKHTIAVLLAKAFISGQSEERNSVDHIDQNSLNNNLSNLRWATKSEQVINRTIPPGVLNEKNITKNGKWYQFQIYRNNIRHTKCFKTLPEAILYRDNYLNV